MTPPTNDNEDIDAILSRFMASALNNKDNVIDASLEDDATKRERLVEPLRLAKAEAKASLERIMNQRVIEELNSLLKHYHGMDGELLLVIEERMAELTRQLDTKETT